jgi:signal transduction histidine kinase
MKVMVERQAARTELSFLAGGGEMGARMREIDWSSTPLGAAESWPRSLQTAVRIMLTCRQPMFVWWGPSLINLYNDAYRAVLGGKHPQALGQPAEQVWREIWAQVGPRAESALLKDGTYDESLLLIMERNGYPEETYYTFSYSPIPDDAGGNGGIICANTEETVRIQTERQLALLRELATGTADARSMEAACTASVACLDKNPHDFPFALLYLLDPATGALRLAGSTEPSSSELAPRHLESADAAELWPFAQVMRTNAITLVSLAEVELSLLPTGAWPIAPKQAAVVPLATTGERGTSGFLVVGLSPYRLFDAHYRGLLELSAGQIAMSFANALAYERERTRAESLAELDRAKTAFFSNVSHEFRTPLTLMLGPTEDALASEAQTLSGENLQTVYRNELRLLKLVNTLLDFARIEAGRAQALYRELDLAELTADLASVFRSAIERAGLRFVVDCEALPERMFIDPDMWEKIVLNLLSNALKFTFEGQVALSLRWHEGRARLTVEDTGIGIPTDELPQLFERFHRVRNARARTHEGSGIGLALVHELVRLHGGSIDVVSAPGRGTRFVVDVPAGSQHLAAEHVRDSVLPQVSSSVGATAFVEEALRWLPSSTPAERQVEPGLIGAAVDTGLHQSAGKRSGESILVVDDNADMRDYLYRLLSTRWKVQTAADGIDALEHARAKRPALIVTDVMMPRLDGFGLLRELRAHDETRDIPVVMLSARAGEEARVEGLRAGVEEYLVKPFSARELTASIEAQLARAALRRVEEAHARRSRAIFESAPVGIAILRGPELVYELANAAYLTLVGPRQLLGKPIRDALPELTGQGAVELLHQVYRTGEPYVGRSVRQLIELGTDQGPTERFFDFVYQPLRDEHGQIESVIVVAFDVSELSRARREAESANRAKDEFLAMLGHELRNPLAPIVTALHLMHLRAGGVAERERAVIERQVGHLTRLVDDLLDVSRIARGKVALERAPVEIAEVVAKALELASPLLERRKHQLVVDVPARGLQVFGDVTRLAQILGNLLTNAAKYTNTRGRVEVHAEQRDSNVLVRVIDNGIGIAREVLPTVFETFVQEQQAIDRSHGGLGLGLAIVRNLVTLHGGRVHAFSEGKGHGSEFSFELPLWSGQLEAAPVAQPEPSEAATRALKVLVVDDNTSASELLGELLRELGHEPRIAHDGHEALALVTRSAAAFTPQLCLLDLGLPEMDGYELARRLRALPQLKQARLVAITGYGQPSDRESSRAAGFDEHLVKPVAIEQIERIVNTLSRSHTGRR